jgi:segregation and condensation protein A
VSLSLLSDPSEKYSVQTEVFQGPLDLLLQLIEKAELDIGKIALAHVTDQFIAHMRLMQDRRAERVSDFLVVASRLMQIKSEALLPRPVVRQPDEEDPGEALVQQLIMYKRFKEIAKLLSDRQKDNLRSYVRLAKPPKIEAKLDFTGLGPKDLLLAATQAWQNQEQLQPLSNVVNKPRVTIREKINLIAERVLRGRKTPFTDLVKESPDNLNVVVTFLAVLELVRRYRIAAHQDGLFAEIELERSDDWSGDLDFDIEFAE